MVYKCVFCGEIAVVEKEEKDYRSSILDKGVVLPEAIVGTCNKCGKVNFALLKDPPGWIQYKCRGCGGVCSALKDSLCGHYQVCETCARKKSLGDSNMLPPGQVWLKEGSPGSGRFA